MVRPPSVLCLLSLIACTRAPPVPAPEVESEVARWQARAARVVITRDDWGVPHIEAPTDADAVFGLMYAQAEDDFPRIEENFLFSQGRLAEAYGEEKLFVDLRMQLFIDPGEMKALYAQSPAFLRALMDGWADGLNYFLHTHPEVRPRVLTRFEPWMALTFSEGSIGGDIERVDVEALRAFYGGDPRAEFDRRSKPAEPPELEEPQGSNGIAIAPARTRDGHALLLINPHTSFFFRHEAHVQSDEGLNAYGALTWGQFFVYQGFNEKAGWMHTSSRVDNIDEFAEVVVERDGELFYLYGDEARPVEVKTVSVSYRTKEGMKTREFETYRTHHGPIVRAEDGRWIAVALMEEPMKALIQSYTRTKAKNLGEYLAIMEAHTNSSNNTVFADSDGNIAYLHSNFVPVRDPTLDYSRPVDGSDPDTDWQGVHSTDESPNAINPPNGWVQNTNNWPYSAAGPNSPRRVDYPPYMDTGSENARGIHALALLEDAHDLTLDGLVALAFDPHLPAFDTLLPPLLAAYDALPRSDPQRAQLKQPIAVLGEWDRRFSTESVATTVAVFWATALLDDHRPPRPLRGLPLLQHLARLPGEVVLQSLSDAVDRIEGDFGDWRTRWGEINRFQRLSGDLQLAYADAAPSTPVGLVSGRWGALAAFGSAPKPGTKKWYGTRGNSFVAVVEFGERVRARAITAGGLSNDPDSPHFNDQPARYATGDLREVYFYPDQLAGHVESRYHPGERGTGRVQP